MSSFYDAQAWHEQAGIERRDRETKRDRIVRAAQADPGITLEALKERFAMPGSTISRVLKAAGIKLQPDGFAAYRNGTKRTG